MKKEFNFKKNLAVIISGIALSACNGGGSDSPPAPNPEALPNVFDSSSVQEIRFETLSLSGNRLNSIDLTKVAGHASYKIKISNPNNFSMKLSKLGFTKETSMGNYYFSKNMEPDNCFNQKWYSRTYLGATLNLPAKASCFLYTTSLWLGPEQQSYNDTINYTVNNEGFGFEVKNKARFNLWCQSGCFPVGASSQISEPLANYDSINFICKALNVNKNEILNAIPTEGFALGGDYVFSKSQATVNQVSFTRYKVDFNATNNQLNLGAENQIVSNFTSNTMPIVTGFATRKDGKFITYTYNLVNKVSATNFQKADTVHSGAASITGEEPTLGLQGLDNELFWNSVSYHLFFQTYRTNYPIAPLNQLASTLPFQNSILLGVNVDGNMVIKSGSNINCYSPQSGYIFIPNLGSFNSLADTLISSKNLYTNSAAFKDSYYDFNNQMLIVKNYYPVDSLSCQVLSGANNVSPYLVVPAGTSLIATDKYTLIKTSKGYAFAAVNDTSDGSNNLQEY